MGSVLHMAEKKQNKKKQNFFFFLIYTLELLGWGDTA